MLAPPTNDSRPLVFSTGRYHYLADAICQDGAGRFERGALEQSVFPDGEHYQRLLTPISARDVVLVGGTISETDTLELFDLACAIVHYGAGRLTLVIPYFGYSTMERAVKPQEVVTAKTRARLFSAIPPAANGSRVVLVDLHSEGVHHYFEGGICSLHLYAKPVIKAAAVRLAGDDDFVLACTDAGRAKWVESLANDLGVPAAFVFKRRLDGARTEVTAVSAHVQDKMVIIYDDMIRTGGSLVKAAEAYKAAGANRIAAIATHGLFSAGGLERIKGCGLFEKVVCTDSHPNAVDLESDFLRVESIAGILGDFLAS